VIGKPQARVQRSVRPQCQARERLPPYFHRRDHPYAVADLLTDEARPVVGPTGQLDLDEFLELGNKVAMMPIIWR
jgi:hypothetical protein